MLSQLSTVVIPREEFVSRMLPPGMGDPPDGTRSRNRRDSSRNDGSASGRRQILLVEDDRGVSNAIAGVLEEEGHSVALAENGRQALDQLQSAPSPDLIILDLRMPVMDGWEFRAAQKSHPGFARIPVLAVSAERSARAAAIDADAYLRKPLDREVLLGVITQITHETVHPSGEQQTFSLNDLVDAALATVRHHVERRAQIRKLYGELHPAVGDRETLRQVLADLIINVAQTLPEGDAAGSVVTLRTCMKSNRANLDISASGSGGGATTAIAPRPARPADDRTAAAVGACVRIVKEQGGRVELDDAPRGGALLRVLLPLGLPTMSEENVRRQAHAESTRPRILVIDDVSELGRAIVRGLFDYDVTAVTSADAAFRVLADRTIDVILCDVAMPGRGGREVLARLERDWPHLVQNTIFMTGGAFSHETRTFLQRISQKVLIKPFSLDELRAALLRTVRERAASV